MNKDKCHVQIMEELLVNMQPWEIEDSSFIEVKNAYNTCLNLLWIEEKFNIVAGNFYEWEQEIKNSYDFMIKNQSDRPNCKFIMTQHGTEEIIVFNRRLANVLSSIRMYRDQVLHDLSNLDNELKSNFEKETNRQYDKTYSYQIMELLRNYMQHQGLVIERITAFIPFCRKIGEELWYFVEADYSKIKRIDRYKQKIKCEPKASQNMEWINLIGILREYYTQIAELHGYFRTITQKLCLTAITCIEQNVKNIYEDLPVTQIAYYGKEDSREFEEFLLQMIYIERLKKYREKAVVLDTNRYYIQQKCFLESDKIRVTNSVKYNFRYNK